MKKHLLLFISLLLSLMAQAQEERKSIILPGKGHLDVEQFNRSINTNMDISQLSLSELRVLRNAFAARQGYIFDSADLRSIFGQTSWYDQMMWKHFEEEDQADGYGYQDDGSYKKIPLKYSPAEQAFIAKIQAREKELREQNFKTRQGQLVNVDNMLNSFQLSKFDPRLKSALGKNGFAIVPGKKIQLFHIYEKNDYSDFPWFVTTDLYLQLYHFYFDNVLRSIEEEKFDSIVGLLSGELYKHFSKPMSKTLEPARRFNQAYFAIAQALVTGKDAPAVSPEYQEEVSAECNNVMKCVDTFSDFLGYKSEKYAYSLYRPRGHYTRSEKIKRYFRAMMWLQTVHFGSDKESQFQSALLLAEAVGGNPRIKKIYNTIFEPITFLMGEPDNVTILQVYDEMKKTGKNAEAIIGNKKDYDQVRKAVEELANKQIRISPKYEVTSHCKINFMPQRYQPDGEVLNEMVDVDSKPTKRATPSGLDIFASLGCSAAERILLNEQHEDTKWGDFKPMLEKMKQRMKEIGWDQTVAKRWISTLADMNNSDPAYPYFMKTPQWEKKNLNTALASWAELKHDAILYAKQPAGAECGDYGPPEPTVKGYVEPNVRFWQKAITLLDVTNEVLEKFGLVTEKASSTTERLRDQAEFFLEVSQKELAGKTLTKEEYDQIEIIGATFENISLDLVRENDQWLEGWDNVQGPDKSIAVVADVYTANSFNNPNPSILYEGVGPAYEIYVVVEMGGELWLTRGAVFSYREFQQSTDQQRLTDEEWQEKLKTRPRLGCPKWMDEITIPLEEDDVEDNEEVFYSSGC